MKAEYGNDYITTKVRLPSDKINRTSYKAMHNKVSDSSRNLRSNDKSEERIDYYRDFLNSFKMRKNRSLSSSKMQPKIKKEKNVTVQDYSHSNIVIINYKNYPMKTQNRIVPKVKHSLKIKDLPATTQSYTQIDSTRQNSIKDQPVGKIRKREPSDVFTTSTAVCHINIEDSYSAPIITQTLSNTYDTRDRIKSVE